MTLTPEERKKRKREAWRKYAASTPEKREKFNAYRREWYHRPEVKARCAEKARRYKQSPKARKRESFRAARHRAKVSGKEFTLVFEDIHWPEFCPVLGMKLNYCNAQGKDMSPDSPSMDRVDSSKGYTPENVRIISNRANILKRNGTITEFEAIVRYMKEHLT